MSTVQHEARVLISLVLIIFFYCLTMIMSRTRPRVLIDSGLSNAQAKRLSQELAERGVGVECTPSRLAGWDVWAYSSPNDANAEMPAND